jgi:hypothetical protein
MPSDVSLDKGRIVLVLSNKKDAYYTVTEKKCSCPVASYHHGSCKHQRRYFPQGEKPTATASEPGSIRPTGKWPGGMNGPVDPSEIKAVG